MNEIDTEQTMDEETARGLLAEAGRRAAVPAAELAALTAVARAAWQDALAARRRRRVALWSAAAASLMLVAAAWWWRGQPTAPFEGPVVASLERFAGASAASGVSPLQVGAELRAGAELRTEDGFLSLRMAGRSLRLGSDSQAALVAADRVALRRGTVYIDSGGAALGDGLAVETALGTVRETGTQFEVRLANGDQPVLRVRVREGSVALERAAASDTARAGEEISLRADGVAKRGRIAPDAADWTWAIAAAPEFAIEGARLGDFLDWFCRETARELRFADRELELAARQIVVHGDSAGMTPEQAAEVVLPSSGLHYELEPGTLRIERPRP